MIGAILALALPVCAQDSSVAKPTPAVSETGSTETHIGPNVVAKTRAAKKDKPATRLTINPSDFTDTVESTVFDLYVADTFRGSVLATYTKDWLELDDPSDVTSQVPELKNPKEVQNLFTGKIFKERREPGVGAVVVDLNTFRVIFNPESSSLPVSPINLLHRLPDPENDLALQQTLFGSAAETLSGRADDAASFTHRSVISSGRYFGIWDGSAVSGNNYQVTEGSFSGIADRYQFGMGLLRTSGQMFVGSGEHLGFHLGTTDEILIDRDSLQGSGLEIFVPSRSQVKFFKGPRLLSVQTLDFGLQQVDTRSFPQGSYDVDVVITENSGNVTSERHFFTKSTYLPIEDYPLLSFDFGALRRNLTTYSIPVYEGHLNWRTSEISALDFNIFGADDRAAGQLSNTLVWRDYMLQGGLDVASHDDWGLFTLANGRIRGVQYYGNYSQSWGNRRAYSPSSLTPSERAVQAVFDRIDSKSQTLSMGVSYPLDPFVFRYSLSRNRRSQAPILVDPTSSDVTQFRSRTWTYGPQLDWRIIENRWHSLHLALAWLSSDLGNNAYAYLAYRYNFDKHWDIASNVSVHSGSQNTNDSLYHMLNYQDLDPVERGVRATLSDELLPNGGPNKETRSVNQAQLSYENDYLHTEGFLKDSRSPSTDISTFGVNAGSSFIVSASGDMAVSRPLREGGVLIAQVNSNTTKSEFELLINDIPYGKIFAGKKAAFGVSPFRTYTIKIRPTEATEVVDYDNTIYKVTFFPGDVVKKVWSANRIVIVFGRVVDESGNPLGYQRIRGPKEYIVTEPDGNFQAELVGNEQLYIESKSHSCVIDYKIPVDRESAFTANLGDLVCRKQTR